MYDFIIKTWCFKFYWNIRNDTWSKRSPLHFQKYANAEQKSRFYCIQRIIIKLGVESYLLMLHLFINVMFTI